MEGQNVPKITQKVGFIGGGNMARAIIDGIINKKVVSTDQIYVSGPHLERLTYFKEKGVNVTGDNFDVVRSCDLIFICVKPYMLEKVAKELRETEDEEMKFGFQSFFKQKTFISVLAATTIKTLEKCFGTNTACIRVMPNTPSSVGEGCSLLATNRWVDGSNKRNIKFILESLGLCLEVQESQINAMAAISGSGPAYMYNIIEALADGGVKMGVPRDYAVKLAAQTMLGAAKMVLQSGKHSAQLKDEVCSAGGTTIAGVHALEKGGLRCTMMDAVEAATKRAVEMEQQSEE